MFKYGAITLGQAKAKRRDFDDLRKRYPNCIYCGGTTPATGVDHFPGRIMFVGKDRPKGWEFPACDICNTGAKHVDLVAACLARLYPEPVTKVEKSDQRKVLEGIRNNIPKAFDELMVGRGAQKIALGQIAKQFDVGAVRIGPIQQQYLKIFCLKFALAAHFEATRRIVPVNGAVVGEFLTNFEALHSGDLLTKAQNIFPSFSTLRQGKKHVSDQFKFAVGFSEQKDMSITVARFRQSFEVYGSAAHKEADFSRVAKGNPGVVSTPRDLKKMIQQL